MSRPRVRGPAASRRPGGGLLGGAAIYDARVTGRWTSIFFCLAAALLLIVLIDGWAIGFLPRVVEKLFILAAFLVLVGIAVQAFRARGEDR
jgi:hypothetical protein